MQKLLLGHETADSDRTPAIAVGFDQSADAVAAPAASNNADETTIRTIE